ncbi:hypothetical protein [Methanococcoides methylutens]|nr:hypothetical protein [Methanococcoides methylutens]
MTKETTRISLTIRTDVLKNIDESRGLISRSRYITEFLNAGFEYEIL